MRRYNVIGNPEQYITNLALVTRTHGEGELIKRLGQLNRTNLLTLLPPGVSGDDQTLRVMVKALVLRRLAHILDSRERVDRFMAQPHPYDERAEQAEGGRLWLNGDMAGRKFKGNVRKSREELRDIARMSFARDREVRAQEIKDWDREIRAKNKEGLG